MAKYKNFKSETIFPRKGEKGVFEQKSDCLNISVPVSMLLRSMQKNYIKILY